MAKSNLALANIWHHVSTTVVQGELIRVVESQEQIATNALVDSLEEQKQLEELLEQSKPAFPKNSKILHYLLSTPFRYPPLMHGSRFGSRFKPSLFYGSKNLSTAFAETAYYRFYFWLGMRQPPLSGKLVTELSVFRANYYSTNALKLQSEKLSNYDSVLTDPGNYEATQAFGNEMRENGIEVFEYTSARDVDKGINVALFYPKAFVSKKPKDQQQWLCETTENSVSFSAKEGRLYSYPLESFLCEGVFPIPAT